MLTRLSLALLLPLTAATAAEPPIPPEAATAAAKVREVIGHKGSWADRPENTLAGIRRAIEAKADVAEVDVRTTKDGVPVCLHDAAVDRTTDGKGDGASLTLAEVKELDAGGKFDRRYKGERIPTLQEVLALARGKIAVMIDLKEDGQEDAERVAAAVKEHGEPKRVVVGIRSVDHARRFRKLLPDARPIGLVPEAKDIEAFADEGGKVIRMIHQVIPPWEVHKGKRSNLCSLTPHTPSPAPGSAGFRISDFGFRINATEIRNPQSAIRNPQSGQEWEPAGLVSCLPRRYSSSRGGCPCWRRPRTPGPNRSSIMRRSCRASTPG